MDRYGLAPDSDHRTHPDFTDPEAARTLAKAIAPIWETQPFRHSISIGIGDHYGYILNPQAREFLGPNPWFREKPDLSNLYFYFANQVAGELFGYPHGHSLEKKSPIADQIKLPLDLRPSTLSHEWKLRQNPEISVSWWKPATWEASSVERPKRYLGLLAYQWLENVPDLTNAPLNTFPPTHLNTSKPVHPRLIPYLTADRSQWRDPDFQTEDQELIRRWVESGAEKVGLYDYYYGRQYLIPRVFTQQIAESIRFAHDTGVRGFYAEAYPILPYDAPKLTLATQLLQDVTADPEAVLDEYYSSRFGEAAPAVRQFFKLAERQWTTQPGRGRWIRLFCLEQQAELWPKEARDEAANLLNQTQTVLRLTDSGKSPRADRVSDSWTARQNFNALRRAWDVTDSFCQYYEAKKAIALASHKKTVGAASRGDLIRQYTQNRESFYNAWTTYQHHPHRQDDGFHIQRFRPVDPLPDLILSHWDPQNPDSLAPFTAFLPRLQAATAEIGLPISASDPRYAAGGIFGDEGKALQLLDTLAQPFDWQNGMELLEDPGLENLLTTRKAPNFWGHSELNGPWREDFRPAENLRFEPHPTAARSDLFGFRIEGSHQNSLFQWVKVTPGNAYHFSIWMRGTVSLANRTYFHVAFRDDEGNYLHAGHHWRMLYPGELENGTRWKQFQWLTEAPPDAVEAFISVTTVNQETGDVLHLDDASILEYSPVQSEKGALP